MICKQPFLHADDPGRAKKSERQHRDIFKIHISWKTTFDYNFEFNYSNREGEKPEIIKFMSNILPCPWEFRGDSLKFRIGTDREYFGLRKYI